MYKDLLNPNSEILNSKQILNPKFECSKHYDLEQRTLEFTKRVINYVNNLPKNLPNIEISKQLIRSAGSIGANYIEANEALGKKDFIMRIKISRKEAKESCYWLELAQPKEEYLAEKESLLQEATELMKIFGSIFRKSE